MAEYNIVTNKDAIKALIDGAGLPIQNFPNKLASSIVPVIDLTPDFHRFSNIVKNATATGTIYTTPSDRDFYLTACSVTISTNEVAGAASNTITITPKNGVASVILGVNAGVFSITSVPTTNSNAISFPFPILLERGSAITATKDTSTATGNFNIVGVVVDTYDKNR